MTDEEEDSGVLSPEEAAGQADAMHSQLNQMKEMALGAAGELEARADNADDSDSAENLREAAEHLRTVYKRIEHGDRTMVRQNA